MWQIIAKCWQTADYHCSFNDKRTQDTLIAQIGSLITTEPKKLHVASSDISSFSVFLNWFIRQCSAVVMSFRWSLQGYYLVPADSRKEKGIITWSQLTGCFTSTLLLLVSFYCLTFLFWQELLDEVKVPMLCSPEEQCHTLHYIFTDNIFKGFLEHWYIG